MSRKGASSASKSKQIPRIFQRRRSTSTGRGWTLAESGVAVRISEASQTSFLSGFQEEHKREEGKKGKQKETKDVEGTGNIVRSWTSCHPITSILDEQADSSEKTADAETVADIEKWLKTRTESVSSMDLDTIKSEVEEGVDRYLGDELPHTFLGKDPDVLSIGIDLSDKKLTLGYDPLLQELQSEKLLEACEKDEFILPEFQLDHLDPLALSPDDMMVAGEILPSTSTHLTLNVETSNSPESSLHRTEQDDGSIVQEDDNGTEDQDLCDKSTQVDVNDLPPGVEKAIKPNSSQETTLKSDTGHSRNIMNVYVEAVGSVDLDTSSVSQSVDVETEENSTNYQKLKLKTKLKPRIIKKRRKSDKANRNSIKCIKGDNPSESKDGIMAVVAISTNKVSNMTQIVINTGKEEQIYQGKTSELIEATGNFPKLPKIDAGAAWNSSAECNVDGSPNNQHELVISNALEELGITDDTLQPISITEHGKVWLCPREDCSRQFSRLYALKGHLLAHYGVRPFKCDFEGCSWAFYSEFKLKRHKETHLKRKDYVCEVEGCNRRFTTVYNLWSHEKLHSRPNRVVCHVPGCQEKFQTKRALELHMKSHDQSHAPYVCKHEGCGKRYYSSNALTSHQRCHSYKEVDIKCSWPGCGKVFDKPCRLKAHIRSHTGCKPYLCTFQGCQWAFSSSSKLKRHQKKHTNERKFVCDVASCGKAFMRSEHLKEHRLTHKEGRYFQCYLCDARFSAKSSLYVHIKKHQLKDNGSTVSRVSNASKNLSKKESHCSRVNPIAKTKKMLSILDPDGSFEDVQAENQVQITEMTENEEGIPIKSVEEISIDAIDLDQGLSSPEQLKTLYHCPVETCTRSYTTKATLRAHMLKVHGTSVGVCDKTLKRISTTSVSNMDYILYTAPCTVPQPADDSQMIMVASCDALILSTSPEIEPSLPEPEPPPLNSVLKVSQSSHYPSIRNQTSDEQQDQQQSKRNQGSARTGLTCADVWKLKTNGTIINSVVGATDVVLGAAGLGEGLLLTEELPSMYYEDDIVGTECQVLLLDSGPPESTINLRDLE
ncbi:uncharacterized protein LOC107264280 [Cephus cinctus]|uniref:Uncharacterized protein LOC107264280 n=1 Tax=Cephus cinctus TaxID=211228 RepID=A0AAJ7FEJ0_CEPCN|nr:uncharacterized protein LOC107264280 [Cephus cinctus]